QLLVRLAPEGCTQRAFDQVRDPLADEGAHLRELEVRQAELGQREVDCDAEVLDRVEQGAVKVQGDRAHPEGKLHRAHEPTAPEAAALASSLRIAAIVAA